MPSHYSTGAALHIVTTIVLIYKLFMLNMFADYHWRDIVFQMHFQDMLKKIMKSCFKSKMEDILSSSEDVVSSKTFLHCTIDPSGFTESGTNCSCLLRESRAPWSEASD